MEDGWRLAVDKIKNARPGDSSATDDPGHQRA